jgi:hypothetical protein
MLKKTRRSPGRGRGSGYVGEYRTKVVKVVYGSRCGLADVPCATGDASQIPRHYPLCGLRSFYTDF